MLNPNQSYKDRELKGYMMMTEDQRIIIERQCKKHSISLITLTTKVLGYRKKTRDLTHIDAAMCIMTAGVWENLRKAGVEDD